MDRLLRTGVVWTGIVFVLAGCSTGLDSGPASTPQAAATGKGRCESSSAPSWVMHTGALEGVGDSTLSQEDADKTARIAVIKQLEVSVTGEDSTITVEETGGKISYRAESSVTEGVNIRLSGLDIVKRYTDVCRSRFYALARLDSMQAVHAWQIDLRTALDQRNERKHQLTEASVRSEFLAELDGWARLFTLDSSAAQLERRIEYLAPDQRPTESSARRVEQDRHEFNTRLGRLQLYKVSGDDQTAKPARSLTEPLIVRVAATLPSGVVAVPNVVVQFVFETGQGEVDAGSRTNSQGQALAAVRSVAAGVGNTIVGVRVAIDQLGLDLPTTLAQDAVRRMSAQVVRFNITAPPVFTDGTSLSRHLHELALALVSNVNISAGSLVVMKDFVENRTKRRLSFSSRIEQGLSSGLVQTGVLRVVEEQGAGKPSSARAVVFGVYEVGADGSVWISAKLRSLSDDVIEATAEHTILRDAISENDARELTGQVVTTPPQILSTLGVGQTYNQWVENFWDLQNPSGFKTELRPEREQYHRGEKAVFRFRTTRDCYLTAVNIGASGAWTVLLPNTFRSDPKHTLIRASEGWVRLPSNADGFDFSVGAPFGTERVKTICALRPITLIANMNLTQSLFQLTPREASRLRDLKVTQATMREEDWSEGRAEFRSLEAGQTETAGLRGLRQHGLMPK